MFTDQFSYPLSMTGFGHARCVVEGGEVVCEIRSLNHRGLDVKICLPEGFLSLEAELLAQIQKTFLRGRIEIYVSIKAACKKQEVIFNETLAHACLNAFGDFARQRTDIKGELSVRDLLLLPELFIIQESAKPADEFKEVLLLALKKAILGVWEGRVAEGKKLFNLLRELIISSQKLVEIVRLNALAQPPVLFEEMRIKLAHLLRDQAVNEDRIFQEAAFLAQKWDTTEEIDRLMIHFDHFLQLCTQGPLLGRKLDFLCQEMSREAHTITNKCTNGASLHLLIELKANIERLREQVQNLE